MIFFAMLVITFLFVCGETGVKNLLKSWFFEKFYWCDSDFRIEKCNCKTDFKLDSLQHKRILKVPFLRYQSLYSQMINLKGKIINKLDGLVSKRIVIIYKFAIFSS